MLNNTHLILQLTSSETSLLSSVFFQIKGIILAVYREFHCIFLWFQCPFQVHDWCSYCSETSAHNSLQNQTSHHSYVDLGTDEMNRLESNSQRTFSAQKTLPVVVSESKQNVNVSSPKYLNLS